MLKKIYKLEEILKKRWISYSAIAALALIVYCNSFSAPFILDDYGSIANNYSIRDPLDLFSIWKFYSGRFLAYVTFSWNYALHGTIVEGYHIVNLMIHIFNGILVYSIFYHLLGLEYFNRKVPGRYRHIVSTVAALLFVCHPMQINAVTYVVQRIASLSAMFYLLAILFFIKYRIYDRKRYFFSVVLFTVLAMYTKENSITIPFMLLCIELLFFIKDGKTSWKKRILFMSVLFLTVPIIPGTLLILKGYSQSDPNVAFKASTNMNRFEYFYTELNVLILYIKLLFVPYNQNFDYGDDFPRSLNIWQNNSYISGIILLFIGLAALWNVRKNKLISLGILWFFIGISVESSFISIKDVYFEHRVYFPSVGFIMCLVGIAFIELKRHTSAKQQSFEDQHSELSRLNSSKSSFFKQTFLKGLYKRPYLLKKPLIYFVIASFFLIPFYSTFTLVRNYVYSDEIRLWSDVVKKAPGNDRAHCVLATSYLNKAESNLDKYRYLLNDAEKEFKKSIKIRYANDVAHCNLSKVYLLKKEYDKCTSEAYIAYVFNNNSPYALNNLGLAYKGLNRMDEAIKNLVKGYNADKKCTFVIKSLADTYYDTKDYKNAEYYYKEYLKLADNHDVKKKLEEIKQKRT